MPKRGKTTRAIVSEVPEKPKRHRHKECIMVGLMTASGRYTPDVVHVCECGAVRLLQTTDYVNCYFHDEDGNIIGQLGRWFKPKARK